MQQLFRQIQSPEEAPPWGLPTALLMMVIAFAFFSIVGLSLGMMLFANSVRLALTFGWLIGGIFTVQIVLFTQRAKQTSLRLERIGLDVIPFAIGMGTVVTTDLFAILFVGRVVEPPVLGQMISTVPPSVLLWVLMIAFVLIVQPLQRNSFSGECCSRHCVQHRTSGSPSS